MPRRYLPAVLLGLILIGMSVVSVLAQTFKAVGTGQVFSPITFAQLSAAPYATAPNATEVFCADCSPGNAPCVGSGSGAKAIRANGAWQCPPFASGGTSNVIGATVVTGNATVDKFLLGTGANAASWLSLTGLRSIYVPAEALYMQGACVLTTNTAVVSGSEREAYVTCTKSDSDGFNPSSMVMPDSWNGGPITVELSAVSIDTTPSGNLAVDFSARCLRGGLDVETAITTVGEQRVTITFSVQNREMHMTSAPLTPNGTCAGGTRLKIQGQVDSTATTASTAQVANIRMRGFKIEYTYTGATD